LVNFFTGVGLQSEKNNYKTDTSKAKLLALPM